LQLRKVDSVNNMSIVMEKPDSRILQCTNSDNEYLKTSRSVKIPKVVRKELENNTYATISHYFIFKLHARYSDSTEWS